MAHLDSTLARRWRVLVRGLVQGVGFRPFVHRLAASEGLGGSVYNTTAGVSIEVEGKPDALARFVATLRSHPPPGAVVAAIAQEEIPECGQREFKIEDSAPGDRPAIVVAPDRAMCASCRDDVRSPPDRRHGYPFTTCTDCGPRYTVLSGLPYDRARTAYERFEMCPECAGEYRSPPDRRFHSQTNGCGDCGPRLEVIAPSAWEGSTTRALADATRTLGRGGVVALKALGGYQILCNARDEAAVRRVREAKHRPEKPLAVLARDLEAAGDLARLSPVERRALLSAEAPIVLAAGSSDNGIAPSVAPDCSRLGVFLPTTPLHLLLADELGFPLVATSGNVSGEPLATDDDDARRRLDPLVDLVLAHDRPILRPSDDSVGQENDGSLQVLRCARGFAPLSLPFHSRHATPQVLALGGFLKSAIALSTGDRIVLGPHLGDLGHPEVRSLLRRTVRDLLALHGVEPEVVAADAHPGFPSRELLPEELRDKPLVPVQHHHAHVESCRLEHGLSLDVPLLGLSWDGTGYGADGTIWGGEFLECRSGAYRRVGRLRPLPLFGGDRAVAEPWRSALGLAWRARGSALWDDSVLATRLGEQASDHALLSRALERGVSCVETSSVGRLFDAASFLAGVRSEISFEGQAAIAFEQAIEPDCEEEYPFALTRVDDLFEIDWQPAFEALVSDLERREPAGVVSARFHNGLATAAIGLARACGHRHVALTGGSFQSRALTSLIAGELRRTGVTVLCHRSVPPGDGGLAAGQTLIAAFATGRESTPAG